MMIKKRDSRYGRLIRRNLIGSGIARLVHFGNAGRRRRIQQINGKYLKEYCPNVWINTQRPIRSADSSNGRYQKGIAASAKNRLRRIKAGTMRIIRGGKASINKSNAHSAKIGKLSAKYRLLQTMGRGKP